MKRFLKESAKITSHSGRTVDELLPPFLKHDSIARLSGTTLYITDRRRLPLVKEEVECRSVEEVAKAIKDMVTQGGGPLEAALLALLLAERQGESLECAVKVLSSARPTNATMRNTLSAVLENVSQGTSLERAVSDAFSYYDALYDAISDIGESIINDGDAILTRCFPEHTFMLSVKKAVMNGKDVTVYVSETRPYLQGAKLTEPSLRAMGVRAYLITDGMPSHFMAEGKITKVMTASDLALSDRTVVNKTGTLSDAISAKYYGIPYYAFSLSITEEKKEEIILETRDNWGEEGFGAKMLYPLFDIIPSSLVTGIITKEGII